MENDKIYNRLGSLFDHGIENVDRLGGKLGDEAASIVHHAREGFKQGRDAIQTAEESLVRAVREYQVMFFIAGVSVLGLMIVASFLVGKTAHRNG